jgi:hypothetical protein
MSRLPVCVAGLGLLTFALLVPAVLGQTADAARGATPAVQPAKPAPPAKAEPRPPLQVKVFRLTRAEPAAVSGVLDSLLGPMNELSIEPVPAGVLGQPPMGQGFGGNVGCFAGLPAGVPLWRAAVNERAKAVIVRGSARHLAVAADVVAVLDRPPTAALPPTKNLQAFELKLATAEELSEVLTALGYDDVFLSAVTEKLLLVVAPAADQKDIADLIKNLDSDGKQDGD